MVDKEYMIIIVLKQIWLDFKTSFSKTIILKKSLWYIFGMAAYVQVLIKIKKLRFNRIIYVIFAHLIISYLTKNKLCNLTRYIIRIIIIYVYSKK